MVKTFAKMEARKYGLVFLLDSAGETAFEAFEGWVAGRADAPPVHGISRGEFQIHADGEVAFAGLRYECDAFEDAYNSMMKGVSTSYADHKQQDAAEKGMALAKLHGAPV